MLSLPRYIDKRARGSVNLFVVEDKSHLSIQHVEALSFSFMGMDRGRETSPAMLFDQLITPFSLVPRCLPS